MDTITLKPYEDSYEQIVLHDIIAFWKTHYADDTLEDARRDLEHWTSPGHELYIILVGDDAAGFLHMGSRGCACDWLGDIFVREEYRGRGIGGTAIQQMWDALQEQGLETMYLEVVPSNEAALRLYHKLGFCNLNTLTLNRSVKKKSQLGTETICGLPFKTYRPHQG